MGISRSAFTLYEKSSPSPTKVGEGRGEGKAKRKDPFALLRIILSRGVGSESVSHGSE